ncbi:MAG TPA: hypothetical protein VMZ30_12300 [Pyrinomonadaceae bacterium]|nr:hypothetical protein [Pyrinomonadaceae bacterium]
MIEEGISILEEIKKGRYEVSVIATFNAYFPFYEEVVLRHLKNSGCRQNLIVMDARVCGGILNVESLRPRLAGKEYWLLPIKTGGAFHPKIVLLLGKKKSQLLIGSHNLTLAGFSHNRELSSRFELLDIEDKQLSAPFRGAWAFIKAWTKEAQPMQETILSIEGIAPWLISNEIPAEPVPLVGVVPKGKVLWEQSKEQLPKSLKRITVAGPFFDTDLKFLIKLHSEYPSAEIVVGIEAKSVVINHHAMKLCPFARFVSAEGLKDGKGYLHAKAILFEEEDGTETLFSGSANPSAPAWLDSAESGGNAEVIAIQKASRKNSIGKQLGLKQLAKAALVSPDAWAQIAERKTTPDEIVTKGHAPLMALVTESGITIELNSLKKAILPEVKILDSHDVAFVTSATDFSIPGELQIEMPQLELRQRATLVELQTQKGEKVLAIVHHPNELRELAQTDRQRAMKDAINSLNTDTPMIEELMRVVEKVIFDDDASVSSSVSAIGEASRKDSGEEGKVQTQFSIPLKDTGKRAGATRRMISSGDLAVLLDALIHQLGIGLQAGIYSAPAIALSEEELIGSDDEEIQIVKELDKSALIALCRRKVKTILRRMVRQLENSVRSEGGSIKALIQTAAVLGLIHRLCQVTSDEAAWIPPRGTLVPQDARYEFFIDAARLLYCNKGVMTEAAKKPDVYSSAEASMVRGLLVWLAWDCDFRVKKPVSFDDPEEVEANLYGLARLLAMVPDLSNDSEAFQKANQAIEGSLHEYDAQDYDSTWLSDFSAWCSEIQELRKKLPRSSVISREAALGDIAYPTKSTSERLFVVAEASQRRVRLIDLDAEDELKTFASSYVTVAKAAI